MIRYHAPIRFAFDEWVFYVAKPSLDAKSYWLGIMFRTLIGLLLFVLPGIIVLVVGLSSGLAGRSTLRERYGDAECVITSRRVIVAGWGQRRHVVEFEHGQIASVTSSGLLTRLLVGKSATIRSIDGRRVKLDRLHDADELVEAMLESMAASRY